MTPDDFITLATALGPNVQAKPVSDTVQLRVGGKTFATLGWPGKGWAVVKVAPSRQAWALSLSKGIAPEPSRRRGTGVMLLQLAAVDVAVAAELLAEAWSFGLSAGVRRGGAKPWAIGAGLPA